MVDQRAETTVSTESDSSSTRLEKLEKGFEKFDFVQKVVLIGLIASILLLAIDLFRDSTVHDRISSLEQQIFDYQKIILEQQERVNCFSIRSHFPEYNCN